MGSNNLSILVWIDYPLPRRLSYRRSTTIHGYIFYIIDHSGLQSPPHYFRGMLFMPQLRRFRETFCRRLAKRTLYLASMGVLRLRSGARLRGKCDRLNSAMGSLSTLCTFRYVDSLSPLLRRTWVDSATWGLGRLS